MVTDPNCRSLAIRKILKGSKNARYSSRIYARASAKGLFSRTSRGITASAIVLDAVLQ